MAIGNHNDLTHIVRTSDQWKNTYDKYELIPVGVLCVELVSSDVTKIKIGDGHNIFSKLPYIGDLDLGKYYTKLETDTRIKEILTQEKVVRIKGIIGSKSDLPAEARCGDIYFVRQLSSSDNKYIEYIYSPDNTWEPLGGIPVDIDLSEYAKTAYVDDKIEQVNERIDDIEQHGTHTHSNKEILDQITEPYTTADKETLASLHNYDDTEIREMISQSSHTHANKDILDATSAAFTREDKSKLDQLNPYDDSTIKERITELERVAHEHSNKRILDQTTASFTKEYERKMRWIRLYTGCTGMEEGIAGLVPAAQAGEEDYVLSGSGEWVPQTGGGGTYELPIATASTLGGIKVGDGLEIDANGKLSVVGGGGGGDSIAEGDGITITTDPQTGVKTISVNIGDHLEVDENTGELNVSGVMEEFNIGKGVELVFPATDTLPAGYGHVDYVKTSGNAWAETDYYATTQTHIIGTATLDAFNTDGIIFGSRGGSNSNQYVLWFNQDSSSPTQATTGFVYGGNTWSTETDADGGRSVSYHQGDLFSFDVSLANGLIINNSFVHPITQNGTISPYKIGIFKGNGVNYYYKGKIYDLKFYEGTTLTANYLPAVRLSDNTVGFYDNISNTFYTSKTSTPFTTDMSTLIIGDPTKTLNAKIGNGLQFDSNDAIEVNTGDGLSINQDNELEVNVGNGLQINQNGEVEIDPSIIPEVTEYEAGEAIEITEVTHGDEFRVQNQEYFFDTRGLTCGLNARVWTTVNDGDILAAMCIHNNGGNQVPLFVGLTEDSVKVSQNYDSTILGPNGSFDYRGKTWYFTADYALSGTDGQDTQGHIQTLPTTYSFNSTPSNFVPAAKDLIDLAVLLSDLEYPEISVKYNKGLTVNQDNELEVNIGSGLSINQDGEIEADQYTLPTASANTLGGVKVGTGLSIAADGTLSTTGGGGSGGGNSGNYIEGEAIEFEEGASRLPTGYTELENISNVSASYIDTGYIPNTDTQLSIIANIHRGTTSWQTLFGARDAVNPGGTEYAFFVRLNDNYNFYPRITGDQYTYMPNQTYDEKIRIDINNTTATVTRQDGSSYSYTQTGSLSNLSTTLAIFALHNQTGYVDNGIIDLYSFKIYENNTIVKDFVPCKRNSDDAIGLIDIANDVFYTNLGTGTFTAGRILTNTSINVKYGDGLTLNQNNELEVSPATQNSIGGIKIGDGLSIDENGVVSSKLYEAGQGIVFDEATPEGQFKVRNLEYYFDNQISCQIDGTYGPRTFTRVSQYEQCLAVIWPRTISGQSWTNPLFVGLTENSVKLTSSADSNILGPSGSFEYRGYTWYYTCTYGLMNSSGVDLLGNLQTMNYTDSTDEVDGSKHLIDLAGLVLYEESIDVWNSGTGWLNGAYNDGQSDQFWTNWYYTYHSKQNEYLEVPAGAIKMRQIGISNENDSRLQGGGVDCFNSSHHHFTTIGCITDEWADIPEGTVYLQFGVKWNELNNRTISSSDIKSVTIEFYYDTPRNDVINAKLGNGLEFDSNDAIQAKLGSGLGFDSNGAIEVTGGSGGDTIAEGDGIEITTDQQTGVKTIGVNVGNGLEIDPITGTLNVTGSSGGGSGDYSAGEAIDIRQSTLTNNIDAIRWDISEIKTNGGPWTQVRYVEFCDSSGTAQTLSTGSGIWEDGTAVTYSHDPAGGGSQEITDMIADTRKMCAAWRGPGHTLKLTFILDTTTAPSNIVKFRMKTGDDEVGRDPKKWKIYVRDSVTQRWYLVHDTENAEVTDTRSTWSNYYNFSTPSDTSINVKYGTGLSVDPITNELFVDGQLPEGTIIKKLTYTGTGSNTNVIQFSKKPLGILALYGQAGGTAKGCAVPTVIDATCLLCAWGSYTQSATERGGIVSCLMSYNDLTNELTLSQGIDVGSIFNISGETYQLYYLTKGHTGSGTSVNNEVSVVKTFSYTGTGTSTNNIQFPETPDMILSVIGENASSSISIIQPIEIEYPGSMLGECMVTWGDGISGSIDSSLEWTFDDTTNVLSLLGDTASHSSNISGKVYVVRYVVNEVIASTMSYDAGEAISIETIGGLQPTNYSNDDFVDSIVSMNAGSIVKAADKSSFTLTASMNDCYTRGSSGQANGSYPFNVKASTKYRFAWDSADPTVHGKVYTYENGLYDAMMHEIDQYDSSYLEFTTSPNTTFIQARFGVMYGGDSITYSNVRLYEVIEDEDQYNKISVKHGDGLIVNERNELEVCYGNGLEIVSNSQYRSEYYFNTQVQCQVHTDSYYSTSASFDRIYQKTTTEPALCCIWEVGDSGALWTGPLLVGTTATSVQYTTQDTQQTVTYQNTFQYLGQTWYTSGYPDFINAADHEDKLGYLQYLGSYPAVSDQIQAAKDLIDLAVINAGSLQAKLGNGLSFDANGAIQVTGGGGGSGDTVAEGAGIDITTDQQTGNKVIAVNAGTGLQVNQTTNELEIDDSVVTEDDELSLVFVPDDYQPS